MRWEGSSPCAIRLSDRAAMAETRKIAAILAADVVGFSRLTSADEDRTLARPRAMRSELIDPTVANQNGRVFKRTGDGVLVEFRSVVEAVRCAIAIQNAMIERNAGLSVDQRIVFRIGIHLGDVVEESDGDLMGDSINIAARLEGICNPGAVCLSEDAYRHVSGRLDWQVTDLGPTQLKNINKPVHAYLLHAGTPSSIKSNAQIKTKVRGTRAAPIAVASAIAISLIAAFGVFWHFIGADRFALVTAKTVSPLDSTHLSIVILPFANLSNDPSQEYFADALTENLTTELARFRPFFVIARSTAFTFKDRSVDARTVGKELGVH